MTTKSMIDMVVLDIAGTTIQDNYEVEKCFMEVAEETGLEVNRERIVSMMGWSKIVVFETLWREKVHEFGELSINQKIMTSYESFKNKLEDYYQNNTVLPTKGCMDLIEFLKYNEVKIVLNTGFYRKITDILLQRIGWLNNGNSEWIDLSVCSDEVTSGRPSPYMIFKAMELLKIQDVRRVIKIGDTPSDLAEGKNAGCLYSCGILGGTHSYEQLSRCDNDGIMNDLFHFKTFLEERVF
jgi:phosphonatase-like hydrolase